MNRADLTFVSFIGLLIITAAVPDRVVQLSMVGMIGMGYLLTMAWNITGSHSPDYATSLKMLIVSYWTVLPYVDPEQDPVEIADETVTVGDETPSGHTYRGRYGDMLVVSEDTGQTLCHVEGRMLRS